MPFDCRVVIWPDKDQVLPVKTPVWFVKKKKEERERERKEKKVYVRSEFQQENFVFYFDTFKHFYLDYDIGYHF